MAYILRRIRYNARCLFDDCLFDDNQNETFFLIYYSKKVLHHLIFTNFLSNFLNKYTKHF